MTALAYVVGFPAWLVVNGFVIAVFADLGCRAIALVMAIVAQRRLDSGRHLTGLYVYRMLNFAAKAVTWNKTWHVYAVPTLFAIAPAIWLDFVHDSGHILTTLHFFAMFVAWRHRGCDGRWRKRRKQAAAKVKEVAGRLRVVPVTPVGSPA